MGEIYSCLSSYRLENGGDSTDRLNSVGRQIRRQDITPQKTLCLAYEQYEVAINQLVQPSMVNNSQGEGWGVLHKDQIYSHLFFVP